MGCHGCYSQVGSMHDVLVLNLLVELNGPVGAVDVPLCMAVCMSYCGT